MRSEPEDPRPGPRTYLVPGMSCEHCRVAVAEAVTAVPGVKSIQVDLDTKLVELHGIGVEDEAVRDAVAGAGYEVMRP